MHAEELPCSSLDAVRRATGTSVKTTGVPADIRTRYPPSTTREALPLDTTFFRVLIRGTRVCNLDSFLGVRWDWVHLVRRPLIGLWWWMWSSRWNENWQGKPKYSEKTCPSATWPDLGPATNHPSYGRAACNFGCAPVALSGVMAGLIRETLTSALGWHNCGVSLMPFGGHEPRELTKHYQRFRDNICPNRQVLIRPWSLRRGDF
jgi:hypothetical protein